MLKQALPVEAERTWRCTCEQCGVQFLSTDPDAWLCPKHEQQEQDSIEVACRAVESPEPAPVKWSRAWKREYLGVTGNADE